MREERDGQKRALTCGRFLLTNQKKNTNKQPNFSCRAAHAVRYKFVQGLTNAIKRPVSMKDLLG